MLRLIFITIAIFSLNSCQNSKNVKIDNSTKKVNLSDDLKIYKNIAKNIGNNNFDEADNLYISLKNGYDGSKFTKNAAINLAIAHIQKKEYILANFYLQEYLSYDSSSEFAKYLLNRNQFLSAVKNSNDLDYLQKALKALETNSYLVYSNDYKILADSMLIRTKLNIAWRNKEISSLYKRLNKQEAVTIYENKIKELGFDIGDIINP